MTPHRICAASTASPYLSSSEAKQQTATTGGTTHTRRTKHPPSSATHKMARTKQTARQRPPRRKALEQSPDRYVVRLSGALAAMCGHANVEILWYEDEVLGKLRAVTLALSTAATAAAAAGVAEAAAAAATSMLAALLPGVAASRRDAVYEDRVLRRLREAGLITYPSPLLPRLLEELPEVLAAEVLSRLDSVDLALFGQAGRACRAAVLASGRPRLPQIPRVRLRLAEFCTSVDRLAWAKVGRCRLTL